MMKSKIIGIYLAAGKSSRMGTNKLALPLGNTTLGSVALREAIESFLHHIVVVTKPDDQLQWLDSFFFNKKVKDRWTQLRCYESDKGQAHSLRCGIKESERLGVRGALVFLADQPFITKEMVNEILYCYKMNEHQPEQVNFIGNSMKGAFRPPVLFTRQVFPVLKGLTGDEGARKLLRQGLLGSGQSIHYDQEKPFFDIDQPEDYEKVKEDGSLDYRESRFI